MPRRKLAAQSALCLDSLGAGDTELLHPLLPDELSSTAFHDLVSEVHWQTMLHRGGEVPRRVAVQGTSFPDPLLPQTHVFPIYRHPADSPPDLHQERFTPTVEKIRKIAEERIGHELNHVLIQHYRGGHDFISEHSDKTLDIVRGTKIINVSLGAQRVMTLRKKKDPPPQAATEATGAASPSSCTSSGTQQRSETDPRPPPRPAQRIPLPDNSLFVMGPETNKRFLHGIHHDNRPEHTKSGEERAWGGERISLTFRLIGTWLVPLPSTVDAAPQHLIYGQGATSKTREGAKVVPSPSMPEVDSQNGQSKGERKEAAALLKAFGEENFSNSFDWDRWYGQGFDIVYLT